MWNIKVVLLSARSAAVFPSAVPFLSSKMRASIPPNFSICPLFLLLLARYPKVAAESAASAGTYSLKKGINCYHRRSMEGFNRDGEKRGISVWRIFEWDRRYSCIALGIMPLSSPCLLNHSMVNAFAVPVAGTLMFKSSRPSLTHNQVRESLLDLIHPCILHIYVFVFTSF